MTIYEYAGTNPLKTTGNYRVSLFYTEGEGNKEASKSFDGHNPSKYIWVEPEGSKFIIQKLLEEEPIRLWITGTGYNQHSQYNFQLLPTDIKYFENALRKLLRN